MLLPTLLRENPSEKRVIVACMPKSGSTFLSTLISKFPGMRRAHLVPGYGRREQEICIKSLENEIYNLKYQRFLMSQNLLLSEHKPRGFVAQMHLKHTSTTQLIIEEYNLKTIVLVRNIFDTMASLADHLRNDGHVFPMAYASEEFKSWSDERLYKFLIDMAAPWYIHFFVSWVNAQATPILQYEDLLQEPGIVLKQAAMHIGLPSHSQAISLALDETLRANTRKNQAVIGRGSLIPENSRHQLYRMASYYEGVDFSPIGL